MNYRTFSATILGLLLITGTVSCQGEYYIPYLMPTPRPPNVVLGVFTPEDMRRRIAEHPAEFRQILDADTAILFAYPHPVVDWASRAFLIHAPSMSEVGLDREGKIQFQQYGSVAGKERLEGLLADKELMGALKARMQVIWKELDGN